MNTIILVYEKSCEWEDRCKMTKNVEAFTEYGLVKGIQKTSVLDCKYNAFLGIPYAKPPVDDLRFKVS